MLNAMQNEYVASIWIIAGAILITKDADRVKEFYKQVDQQGDKNLIGITFTDFIRKSVVTRIYFLIDHYLSCFSEHLTGTSQRQVYNNAVTVQTSLGLSAVDIEVFSALGFTRNAFHNNGSGRVFNFTNDQDVPLHWDDISILIHKAIRTVISWSKAVAASTLIRNQ